MTTRAQLANLALADNGLYDGCDYPGPGNKFDQWLERPNEYWCADTVTYWFAQAGLTLPLMQAHLPGKQTGYAYCPSAVNYGRAHSAVIPSWEAQPGDIVLFDWNGDGCADHTELVTSHDTAHGVLYTIGGDSGPSNIDHFKGQGGVHRHSWLAPAGHGNSQILAVLDASKLVTFTQPAPAPTPVPAWYHRELSWGGVKGQYMTGPDVETVQRKVGAPVDGAYGPNTVADVKRFQTNHHLTPDGIVGPKTATALGA